MRVKGVGQYKMPSIMLRKKVSPSYVELPDLPNQNTGHPVKPEFQMNNIDYFNIGMSQTLNIKNLFVSLKFQFNWKVYILLNTPIFVVTVLSNYFSESSRNLGSYRWEKSSNLEGKSSHLDLARAWYKEKWKGCLLW